MILQALKDYYDRKAADSESGIAPPGWEKKELPFLIVIDNFGGFVSIEDTRVLKGKKKVAKAFMVPQSVKRSIAIAPNLLWDNVDYVIGVASKDPARAQRAQDSHRAFLQRLMEYSGISQVDAVVAFLNSDAEKEKLKGSGLWQELFESGLFISFKIAGCIQPVFRDEGFVSAYNRRLQQASAGQGLCLVSGQQDSIATLHPSIKGIVGANSTGANIVSFNFPAACSFGKSQGENSPVGERAVFAYTTALNNLLSKDSRQKLTIGDATVAFWADKNCSFEDEMASIFDDRDSKDDPDALTGAVAQLLNSVKSGAYHEDREPTRFFVLGLAPNSARISVRFWHQGTVEEMSSRFASWFEDLMIAHGDKMKEHLSMYRLLCSIAALGKSENIPPNLAGNVMRSILEDGPLPETFLQAALRRIKAELGDVSYPRAKIIKAVLNRKIRFQQLKEKEITRMLDKENTNIGYRLGRLFAVLEKIQEAANPGINATIRDKFYASASSTPAAVFGTLMRLAGNHLSKLGKENQGFMVNLEKLIGEITYKDESSIGIDKFPAHLKLDDQGQFAIGYYHQRQDFFVSHKEREDAAPDSQPESNQLTFNLN